MTDNEQNPPQVDSNINICCSIMAFSNKVWVINLRIDNHLVHGFQ